MLSECSPPVAKTSHLFAHSEIVPAGKGQGVCLLMVYVALRRQHLFVCLYRQHLTYKQIVHARRQVLCDTALQGNRAVGDEWHAYFGCRRRR